MDATAQKIADLEAQLAALKSPVVVPAPPPEPFRLDLGCGKVKKEGFKGVDLRAWEGVDYVVDVANDHWPWPDDSVDEAHCSHLIEHLTWPQRVHFFNELGRVMKKGSKVTLIWPHWCAERYWGDPTHQVPMGPAGVYYLSAEWRRINAPHCDYALNTEHRWHEYTCDFDHVISYSTSPLVAGRNQEFVSFAMQAYKDAILDVMATLIKR